MNEPLKSFQKNKFGYLLKKNNIVVFFGNRNSSLELLKKEFPNYAFNSLQQFHSDLVIDCTNHEKKADAHYTNEKDEALLISTADCMPIMLFCEKTNYIAAVHAGWRGVANQILSKTLTALVKDLPEIPFFEFWVGPHILKESFEVDIEVVEKLKLSTFLSISDYAIEKNKKYYINLSEIIKSQISQVLKNNFTLNVLPIDTKKDPSFFSYRREKEMAERNLSFIVKI